MSNPAPGFSRYPDHRVVITPSARHVRALCRGEVIAETRAAFEVDESRHDPVWYFPPEDVRQHLLVPSDTTSYCPFKGHASYFTVELGANAVADAAWAYLTPFDECLALAGYYAFYTDRVTIEVDDETPPAGS